MAGFDDKLQAVPLSAVLLAVRGAARLKMYDCPALNVWIVGGPPASRGRHPPCLHTRFVL
jgi:hypothetical protein